MRRLAYYLLLALQWLNLLWGTFTALMALHLEIIETAHFSEFLPAAPDVDSFSPPTTNRLVVGLCTGFAMMGIGGTHFYLRRLYLAR